MMLLVVLPCAILFGIAAMFFSQPVLTLQDDGGRADVIVVPGGDGPPPRRRPPACGRKVARR